MQQIINDTEVKAEKKNSLNRPGVRQMVGNKRTLEWILALILLLFPLFRANRGIDLMDAGYNLGNFTFFSDMHLYWKIATFLANVTGHVLTQLPFGDRWLGMNIYTGLMVGATALVSYRFLVKRTGKPVIVFLGELVALALCWAPTVVLYHYMTYIFMTFAMMCLYKALFDAKEKKDCVKWFLLSGFLLGANVLVRMPNATHMAFIVCVWYCGFLNRKTFRQVLSETGYCLAGYLAGFGIPFVAVSVLYGPYEYINMIGWLFGITERAADYKPTSMLSSMFTDYIQYSGWLFLFVVYVLVGVLGFQMLALCRKHGMFTEKSIEEQESREKSSVVEKLELIWKCVFTAGFGVLLRFCYGRGMFDFNYHSYFSIYKWITVFLLLFLFVALFHMIRGKELWIKVFSLFCIVEIFVTPLGSNNSLYSIINNLFLVAPFAFYLFADIVGKCIKKQAQYYPVAAGFVCIMLCVVIQSMGFARNFTLHDGADGTPLDTKITGAGALDGMCTTSDKAAYIQDLVSFAKEEQLQGRPVILYGDIPSVSYILHEKPAVFSTWCDLNSNSGTLLAQQLEEISAELQQHPDAQTRPLVIVSAQVGAYLTEDAEGMEIIGADPTRYVEDTKLQNIAAFIEENGYTNTFCNQQFMVFA